MTEYSVHRNECSVNGWKYKGIATALKMTSNEELDPETYDVSATYKLAYDSDLSRESTSQYPVTWRRMTSPERILCRKTVRL